MWCSRRICINTCEFVRHISGSFVWKSQGKLGFFSVSWMVTLIFNVVLFANCRRSSLVRRAWRSTSRALAICWRQFCRNMSMSSSGSVWSTLRAGQSRNRCISWSDCCTECVTISMATSSCSCGRCCSATSSLLYQVCAEESSCVEMMMMIIIFEDIYTAQDRYAANALQSQLHVK